MTSTSDIQQRFRPGPDIASLPKWGWIFALGVVYLITGFVALSTVALATVASVLLVGVMMIIAGVAEVINAFQVKTWGKFLLCALLGALYIVAGLVTFENPALAAVLLTLMLGASLVAAGIMRQILAFSMKRATPRFWLAISGVITLLVGLLILARWPINSVYILGLFLGLDLIMAGASWIGISFGLRRSSIVSQTRSPA
ncbi:HdeD family acid-resistance protein [Bradyrhizobium sp. USDA 10063]